MIGRMIKKKGFNEKLEVLDKIYISMNQYKYEDYESKGHGMKDMYDSENTIGVYQKAVYLCADSKGFPCIVFPEDIERIYYDNSKKFNH